MIRRCITDSIHSVFSDTATKRCSWKDYRVGKSQLSPENAQVYPCLFELGTIASSGLSAKDQRSRLGLEMKGEIDGAEKLASGADS
jgi:hypothetical protein